MICSIRDIIVGVISSYLGKRNIVIDAPRGSLTSVLKEIASEKKAMYYETELVSESTIYTIECIKYNGYDIINIPGADSSIRKTFIGYDFMVMDGEYEFIFNQG